jgi:hypothetical protein
VSDGGASIVKHEVQQGLSESWSERSLKLKAALRPPGYEVQLLVAAMPR